MPNRGATPIDLSTPVGRLRYQLGDTSSKPLEPAEAGFADYAVYSDDALMAFLYEAGDNVFRAAGNACMRLAMEYAAAGKSIRKDDLAIDIKGRGADLHAIAKSFFSEARQSELAAEASFFEVGAIRAQQGVVRPQGTPQPYPYL